MAHLRELMETDFDAAWKLWHLLAGESAFPSRICVNARGLMVGDRGPKASVWPDCGVCIGRPERARQARTTRADAILEKTSRILSENSTAAIAKWRENMKSRGLAARWAKSRSIVGVDLQHHVNWADENHFEQCLASVPLVPRATHLATAKELATR